MDLRSYPALSVIVSKTPNDWIFYRRVVVHPFVPLLESLSRFGSVAGRCVLWLSCRGRGDVDGWRGSTRRSWRGVGTKEEQYCEQLARCWSNAWEIYIVHWKVINMKPRARCVRVCVMCVSCIYTAEILWSWHNKQHFDRLHNCNSLFWFPFLTHPSSFFSLPFIAFFIFGILRSVFAAHRLTEMFRGLFLTFKWASSSGWKYQFALSFLAYACFTELFKLSSRVRGIRCLRLSTCFCFLSGCCHVHVCSLKKKKAV